MFTAAARERQAIAKQSRDVQPLRRLPPLSLATVTAPAWAVISASASRGVRQCVWVRRKSFSTFGHHSSLRPERCLRDRHSSGRGRFDPPACQPPPGAMRAFLRRLVEHVLTKGAAEWYRLTPGVTGGQHYASHREYDERILREGPTLPSKLAQKLIFASCHRPSGRLATFAPVFAPTAAPPTMASVSRAAFDCSSVREPAAKFDDRPISAGLPPAGTGSHAGVAATGFRQRVDEP